MSLARALRRRSQTCVQGELDLDGIVTDKPTFRQLNGRTVELPSCVTIETSHMRRLLALSLNRIVLALALGVILFGVGWLVVVAYLVHTRSGPLNSSGGEPPTACTVQTAEQDCRKLRCISHVWYCDEHGTPTCFQGKCMCWYGCL